MGKKTEFDAEEISYSLAASMTGGRFPRGETAYLYKDEDGNPVLTNETGSYRFYTRGEDESIEISDYKDFTSGSSRKTREQRNRKRDKNGQMRVELYVQRGMTGSKVRKVILHKPDNKVEDKVFFRNGALESRTTRSRTGDVAKIRKYSEFYKNGAKRKSAYYKLTSSNEKSSVVDGVFSEYRKDGKPITRTSIKRGKKRGWENNYNSYGALTSQTLHRPFKKEITNYLHQNALSYEDAQMIKEVVEKCPGMSMGEILLILGDRTKGINNAILIKHLAELGVK